MKPETGSRSPRSTTASTAAHIGSTRVATVTAGPEVVRSPAYNNPYERAIGHPEILQQRQRRRIRGQRWFTGHCSDNEERR